MVEESTLYNELRSIHKEIAALREETRVGFASLPSQYVSQRAVNEARREALVAKRFAFTAALTSFSALGVYIGLVI